MARTSASTDGTAPSLFVDSPDDSTPERTWMPRVFVTTNELRACLSNHVLAPWTDQGPDTESDPRGPAKLVAFAGPVAMETLDRLRPRGPNATWVGLELDADTVQPTSSPPTTLPGTLPLWRVRRIVFGSDDELALFSATRMANVALPRELAVSDPSWFSADAVQIEHVLAELGAADSATSHEVARTHTFRRLFGAAVAVLDSPVPNRTDYAFLLGLDQPNECHDDGAGVARDAKQELSAWPLATDAALPAAAAWRHAAGLRTLHQPTRPLAVVDHHVRAGLVRHLIVASEPTLDRQQLLEAIAATAQLASVDEHVKAVADRYPKALASARRIWRNEVTWERLLEAWPDGFPTLLAAVVMASVNDADQYPVLRQRINDLHLPADVAQLARLLFGLRWGIEAIPTRHRGSADMQRFVETVTWATIDSEESAAVSARLERATGRQAQRPYLLSMQTGKATLTVEVPYALVVAEKFRTALTVAPDALRTATVALAADQPSMCSFVGWRVRLPRSTFQIELDRGRAVLTGAMGDGSPAIEHAWLDWPAFASAVSEGSHPLSNMKRATDLAAWEKVIDDVLAQAGSDS